MINAQDVIKPRFSTQVILKKYDEFEQELDVLSERELCLWVLLQQSNLKRLKELKTNIKDSQKKRLRTKWETVSNRILQVETEMNQLQQSILNN